MMGKEHLNVLDSAAYSRACVCVSVSEYTPHECIHHTQGDGSVFPPRGSERLSVFVSAPLSCTGIITSYFFVKASENNRSRQKIRREK